MIASLLLPLALTVTPIEPAPAEAPVENRTEIALNYASQYINFDRAETSVAPQLGNTCVLVGNFGLFCTFKCDGILVLAECGSR